MALGVVGADPSQRDESGRGAVQAGDYKGFGLALMSEVLCGALSGSRLATEIPRTILNGQTHDTLDIGCFMLAIDITRYAPTDAYFDAIDRLSGAVRHATPLDPNVSVLLPGEREHHHSSQHIDSVQLSQPIIDRLATLAADLNLRLPDEMRDPCS